MSIPVCKFYSIHRKCAFGKNCRFLHSESPGPPLIKPDLRDKHEELLDQPSHFLTNLTITDKQSSSASSNHESSAIVNSALPQQHSNSIDNSRDGHSFQTENEGSNKTVKKPICYYFKTYGNCRFERDCKFSHILPSRHTSYRHNESSRQQKNYKPLAQIPPRFRKAEEQNKEVGTESSQSQVVQNASSISTKQIGDEHTKKSSQTNETAHKLTERRVCRYFKGGYCSRGDYCKFLHSIEDRSEPRATNSYSNKSDFKKEGTLRENTDVNPEEKTNNENCKDGLKDNSRPEGSTNPRSFTKPFVVKQSFSLHELESIDIKKVRDSEINTIKKRFPRDRITILEETESNFCARVLFLPSDPDWAFDVRVFEIEITIPADYPREIMKVVLPVDQNIPETIRRYVEISIKEWLDQKTEQLLARNKVELMFRTFLLWLDRNIEDITMEALKQWKKELVAKAAGMEFIPAAKLQEKFKIQNELNSEEEDQSNTETDDDESDGTSDDSEDDSDHSEDNMHEIGQIQNINPDKKGTEIELRHLQLLENASALIFEKLKLVLQCGRCKNHSDLLVPPDKVLSTQCDKCNQKQFVHFRAALVHQFSSVVGYLDLDGCQAFDLIFQDCSLAVTCMSCSKSTRINGFVAGHVVDGWCRACNARFKLASEAVKFSQLLPSNVDKSDHKMVEVSSSKQKKPPKDPSIREGFPLPEFGTCKHYKHSYRWLRFPCCGKAYPCDICHDKKEDHEMVYATRMICGHCCREQNFSATRPCSSCNMHLTKVRTAHWEGGSGCRDKISMSKNDQQKYKNSNKTVSNHKKKVQTGNSKKITKLRHA